MGISAQLWDLGARIKAQGDPGWFAADAYHHAPFWETVAGVSRWAGTVKGADVGGFVAAKVASQLAWPTQTSPHRRGHFSDIEGGRLARLGR